jgi:hypothetical protein
VDQPSRLVTSARCTGQIREHDMTKYESDRAVQPLRVVTYRSARRAARRGWEVPTTATGSSFSDVAVRPDSPASRREQR